MTEASDRMARSRQAITDYVQRTRHGSPRPGSPRTGDEAGGAQEGVAQGRWEGVKSAFGEWWKDHPVRMGLELAQPVLLAHAGRHPIRLLALSAAAGALLVLARPWRLVSVTGLLLAAIRSPQLSSAILSAIRPGSQSAGEFTPPPRRSP